MHIPVDQLTLPEALVKTIQHFVPDFWPTLARVRDRRDQTRIIYSIQEEILVGILMFMLKTESRRNIKYKLGTSEAFVKNIQCIGKQFYPKTIFPDSLLHGDTLDYGLNGVPLEDVEGLRFLIINALLRKRCLEEFRLLGHHYTISVDGTGCLTYKTKHCDHCLKKTRDGVVLYYYHPVLEAKLTLGNMFAFSIATEFIENENENVTKQDCELKAFYRLNQRLKNDFPQLPICLLLDGLYAGEPVFKICEDNRWLYLITFMEGSMPKVFEEYEALKKLAPQQEKIVLHPQQGWQRIYRWVNEIDYEGRKLNVLECDEKWKNAPQKNRHFVFLSGVPVDDKNVITLTHGGRGRWVIENQGFNMQKNGGYGLEHAFSTSNAAMKNFYVLMQIAHIFNQLMERGSLLRERIKLNMGSLSVFAQKMWAALTETLIDGKRLQWVLAQRIQIRFESG